MARVVVDEAERDLVKRRLYGGDLDQHVDAVTVVLNHALHAADLSLDPAQTLEELVLRGGIAAGRCSGRLCGHAHSIPPPRICYSAAILYPSPVLDMDHLTYSYSV